MNKERLEKYRETAMRTLRILNLIDKGYRRGSEIAAKAGASRQLVEHYLKAIVK